MRSGNPRSSARTRVLHIIRRLDVPRGAERMIAELVRTQPNHDVLVFDGSGSFFDLGNGRMIYRNGLFRATLFCLLNRRRYDCFHLHLPPAIFLAGMLGRRAVIHIHGPNQIRWENPMYRMLCWITSYRKRKRMALEIFSLSRRNIKILLTG